MELIKESKLWPHGLRALTLNIPASYIKSLGLSRESIVEIYREGEKLIIVPVKEEPNEQ